MGGDAERAERGALQHAKESVVVDFNFNHDMKQHDSKSASASGGPSPRVCWRNLRRSVARRLPPSALTSELRGEEATFLGTVAKSWPGPSACRLITRSTCERAVAAQQAVRGADAPAGVGSVVAVHRGR